MMGSCRIYQQRNQNARRATNVVVNDEPSVWVTVTVEEPPTEVVVLVSAELLGLEELVEVGSSEVTTA